MKKLTDIYAKKGRLSKGFNEKSGQSIKEIFDEVCEHSHIDSQQMKSPFTIHNVLSEMNYLHMRYPSKPLCLVSSWSKWELISEFKNVRKVVSRYITASFVIKDEFGDAAFGEAIKSTEIIHDHSDFVVETSSRIFILIGNGVKKIRMA